MRRRRPAAAVLLLPETPQIARDLGDASGSSLPLGQPQRGGASPQPARIVLVVEDAYGNVAALAEGTTPDVHRRRQAGLSRGTPSAN